jgi:purine nucleosidase
VAPDDAVILWRVTALLIDCDTGIDDALALLYACASPDSEVAGVSCVHGNIDARQVAANTRAVLELAGRTDVEVALGRETPLTRPLALAPETHGPTGLGYATLPPPSRPLSERSGPELIVDELERRPGEIVLVTLGPLTNLAVALLRQPALPRLVRRWVLMGGAYRSPGNVAPTTEWNVHCDPEAAKLAFDAFGRSAREHETPRPLALGLDVTERAKFTPDHMATLARRAGSRPDEARDESDGSVATNPVVRFIADALRFYMEFHSRYDGFYGAFIHDAMAVAAALDPTLVRSEALAVDVELNGTLTAGETVTDWRRVRGRPPNLDVAVEADADRFMTTFIERVGGLAATFPVVAR